jgi:hypothetical protein
MALSMVIGVIITLSKPNAVVILQKGPGDKHAGAGNRQAKNRLSQKG